MAFMSSIVVNGHAKAVVTETGMNTRVGKIANMIIQDEAPETPIQKKIESSRKNIRNSMFSNMFNYICNRINKKYRSYGNVYDISRG